MKYIERNFYCCRLIRYPFPIDVWFAFKDRYFGGAHAGEGRKRRHRRSFICCKLPKAVGNKVIYRLFKATRWFKEPNIKYGRKEY